MLDEKEHLAAGVSSESFQALVETGGRLIATGVGIVVILVGLFSAMKIFGALYEGLTSPQGFADTFEQWTETVGGEKLKVQVAGEEYPLAPVLAVIVLGGGAFLLAWLALGIMLTGAKIISWTSGDREAVKKVLQRALGRGGRG